MLRKRRFDAHPLKDSDYSPPIEACHAIGVQAILSDVEIERGHSNICKGIERSDDWEIISVMCEFSWRASSERTFGEIIGIVTIQCRPLKHIQLVHYVSFGLEILMRAILPSQMKEPTKPRSFCSTRIKSCRCSVVPMLPSMKRAELRSFRRDSAAWAKIVGPMDISRQYSTVAAHIRRTSAP